MEVTGRVLQLGNDPVRLGGDFTDRLLACVDTRSFFRRRLARRVFYFGAPIAAAAALTFVILAGLDRTPRSMVLGVKVERPPHISAPASEESWQQVDKQLRDDGIIYDPASPLVSWLDDVEKDAHDAATPMLDRQPADLTVLQMLQLLDDPNPRTPVDGVQEAPTPTESPFDDGADEIEDL